jgi:sugar lactone lactonase YvrE
MKIKQLTPLPLIFALAFTFFASPVLGAAGDLYVGNLADKMFRITPAGTSSIFATGFDPYGIAFNAKGEVFAASSNSAAIFKVAANGTRTTFASALGDPLGLVFDANGNLFAAEFTASAVRKITPDGSTSTFASSIFHADGVTADLSGNLFVSGYSDGRITKISPAGVKTQFATGLSGPVGVACDAGGNLFVAERNGGRITRFTPAGNSSVFSTALGSPYGLVFDAAGDLFASNQFVGTIVRFTPDGVSHPVAALNPEIGFLAIEPGTGKPLNISTRLRVLTGDNALIGGFIITGTETKTVLVRGIGPSLSNFGVPGALEDPTLELFDASGQSLASNNDWRDTQQNIIENSGLAPTHDHEAAIVATLAPGAYTTVERGRSDTTGVALVEVYDLNSMSTARLGNISTRGFVDAGDNVMIGGFIIGAGSGARILARALGPSLAQAGISNFLPDPTLELRDSNGTLLRSNDNWKENQQIALEGTGLPPQNDIEAAITTTLSADAYTVVVAGKQGATGVALVEVYALP